MGSYRRKLVSHLMRRAGFGATSDELDALERLPYDQIVDELLDPPDTSWMGDHLVSRLRSSLHYSALLCERMKMDSRFRGNDERRLTASLFYSMNFKDRTLVRRFHHEQSGMIPGFAPGEYWLYRMVTTKAPLIEKVTLFWHNIFATGYPKVVHGKVLSSQIAMLRRLGLGQLDDLLIELSKDPAMIVWLDNQDNHNGAINENYGRELLELFSMGVGNYSEDDIREAARAFTGWTIGNTEYMVLRSSRDSDWPYGRIAWHFEFNEQSHDSGKKTFLGETGNFNGEDIVEIICRQEAAARFISRCMYHFFVADEPPVPQWPYVRPRDPEAIQQLVDSYFSSGHSIKEMLRTLFKSDFFKSEEVRYGRVKSPAELITGVLRLSDQLDRPRREMVVHGMKMQYMGQWLHNPPSVEG